MTEMITRYDCIQAGAASAGQPVDLPDEARSAKAVLHG